MTIKRELWKSYFNKNSVPKWPCPRCGSGILTLKKQSLTYTETRASREQRYEPDWEPTNVRYVFSGVFQCSNQICQEQFASCGRGLVSEGYTYDEDGDTVIVYGEEFHPEYFYPSLLIFNIPRTCPRSVADHIRESFRLFFSDPGASANHIRKCIEAILTDKGVKRYTIVNGMRKAIPLHQRILLYESKNRAVAERLLAVKWLGNVGSHTGDTTRDDVLDGYEILETVLDDLYVGHARELQRKVSLLLRHKGPPRRKRHKREQQRPTRG